MKLVLRMAVQRRGMKGTEETHMAPTMKLMDNFSSKFKERFWESLNATKRPSLLSLSQFKSHFR